MTSGLHRAPHRAHAGERQFHVIGGIPPRLRKNPPAVTGGFRLAPGRYFRLPLRERGFRAESARAARVSEPYESRWTPRGMFIRAEAAATDAEAPE